MGLRFRNKEEHGFFITTTCKDRMKLLDIGESKEIVEESINFVGLKYKADILGYVIMPNHLHAIVFFKEGNKLSELMRDFKKFTSFKIRKEVEVLQENLLERIRIDKKDRVFQVWQDRFDDVWLKDKSLLETKLEYIHNNPLQEHWSLVKVPEEYEYSSASYYNLGMQKRVVVTDYREFY